jgi:hypothetical protein
VAEWSLFINLLLIVGRIRKCYIYPPNLDAIHPVINFAKLFHDLDDILGVQSKLVEIKGTAAVWNDDESRYDAVENASILKLRDTYIDLEKIGFVAAGTGQRLPHAPDETYLGQMLGFGSCAGQLTTADGDFTSCEFTVTLMGIRCNFMGFKCFLSDEKVSIVEQQLSKSLTDLKGYIKATPKLHSLFEEYVRNDKFDSAYFALTTEKAKYI